MVNFISLTLKESIINSSQLFMSPFSADSLRNCLFRLLNDCDCYKFTATPCALNMRWECWPPAAISLSFCLSLKQITQLLSFFISQSLWQPSGVLAAWQTGTNLTGRPHRWASKKSGRFRPASDPGCHSGSQQSQPSEHAVKLKSCQRFRFVI